MVDECLDLVKHLKELEEKHKPKKLFSIKHSRKQQGERSRTVYKIHVNTPRTTTELGFCNRGQIRGQVRSPTDQ